MTWKLVETMQVAPQSWRNGQGRTRELLAWPDITDWRVRVSVADIDADAPFSSFPGVERWFVVLKGAGVELCIGDEALHRRTRIDPPFSFDGALPVHCRLIDGPTQDLNLMLRGLRGGIVVAEDGVRWQPTPASGAACGLYSAVAGRCTVDDKTIEVPAYALLWFEHGPASLSFRASGRPAGAIGWWLHASPQKGQP